MLITAIDCTTRNDKAAMPDVIQAVRPAICGEVWCISVCISFPFGRFYLTSCARKISDFTMRQFQSRKLHENLNTAQQAHGKNRMLFLRDTRDREPNRSAHMRRTLRLRHLWRSQAPASGALASACSGRARPH
jgi:hypothetical protein